LWKCTVPGSEPDLVLCAGIESLQVVALYRSLGKTKG
jgi:hypothetical protein